MAQRKSSQEWREIVREFGASGLTLKAFCLERSIPESTLGYWRKKHAASKPVMVRVPQPISTRGLPAPIRIVVDEHVTIDLRGAFREEDLAKVVRVLRSVRCS